MVTFLRVEVHDPDTLVPCILTGVGLLPGNRAEWEEPGK